MNLTPDPSKSLVAKAWLIIVLITLIWGSSFLMLKKALIVLSPDQVVAGRMAIAGLAFLPLALRGAHRIPRRLWPKLLLFALIANFGTSFSYALAQSQIDSSLNGILNTLSPLMTLLVGGIFFRQQVRWMQVLGLLLGLLGATYLIFLQQDGQLGAINVFATFSVLAAFGNGWMNNLLKFHLADLRPVQVAAATFLITLLPAIGYWYGSGAWGAISTHPFGWEALAFVATLALLGNGVALILVSRLVQISSPVFASLATYLIPIVAVGWGIWDGEQVFISEIAAMLVISVSVYLVGYDRQRRQRGN